MLIVAILVLGSSTALQDSEAIGKIADLVQGNGVSAGLNPVLMEALGLPEERLPVKQQIIRGKDTYRTVFNVGVRNGKRVIILINRTDDEGWLYLTGPEGKLESAIHATKSDTEAVPLAQAEKGFKAGMQFWVARVPYVECLCKMTKFENEEDYKGLVEVATSGLKAYPEDGKLYSERGYANYRLGRWPEALGDFRKTCELEPSRQDYPRLHIWLIRARLGESEAATEEMAAYLKSWKGDEWRGSLLRFLGGTLSEDDLLKAAEKGNEKARRYRCEAFFYSGSKRLVGRDREGAKALFRKCLEAGESDLTEYRSAKAELKALEKP